MSDPRRLSARKWPFSGADSVLQGMMPDALAAPTGHRLDEGGFACFCTAHRLDDHAWASTVRFVPSGPRKEAPPCGPVSHKVPGVFLDSGSALSAAVAYAVRTVQWERV